MYEATRPIWLLLRHQRKEFLMCNAWNHAPGCDCGWVGAYHGGGGRLAGQISFFDAVLLPSKAAIGEQPISIREAETYTTTCWWCGAEVYYHTNGYGDSVLFDSLGWPWQIHSCWIDYRKGQKALRKEFVSSTFSTQIIQQIEQYENSVDSSAYKILESQISHNIINDQRMAILAGAIKQIRFIPDEFSVANCMGIALDELRKVYGDLYTIDRSTNGIRLNAIKQVNEIRAFQKATKNLPPQVLAIQRLRKAPPKPSKRNRSRG